MRINWFCAIFCPHYSLCHENGFILNHFCSCGHLQHEEEIPQWKGRDTTSDADLWTASPHAYLGWGGRGAPPFSQGVSCCDFCNLDVIEENRWKAKSHLQLLLFALCPPVGENILDGPQRISRRERTGDPEGDVYSGKQALWDRRDGGSEGGASTGLRLLKQQVKTIRSSSSFLVRSEKTPYKHFSNSRLSEIHSYPQNMLFPLLEKYSDPNKPKLDGSEQGHLPRKLSGGLCVWRQSRAGPQITHIPSSKRFTVLSVEELARLQMCLQLEFKKVRLVSG